jgi:hypothetical protein
VRFNIQFSLKRFLLRQCQYKIICMFLDFSPLGVFMETLMTFLCCSLLLFSHWVLGVLHKHIVFKSSDFSHWVFWKYIPLLAGVQVLKGVTIQIIVWSLEDQQPPHRPRWQPLSGWTVVSVPPPPHMYKNEWNGWINSSSTHLSQFLLTLWKLLSKVEDFLYGPLI